MFAITQTNEISRTDTVVASGSDIVRSGLAALARQTFPDGTTVETSNWTNAATTLERAPDTNLLLITDDLLGGDNRRSIHHLRMRFRGKVAIVGRARNRATILAAIGAGAHGYIPDTTPMNEMIEALAIILMGRLFVPDLVADVYPAVSAEGVETAARALTERQHEVLSLLARGASNKEIARHLSLAESTVKVHLGGLFRALGVRSRTAAVATANGLVY